MKAVLFVILTLCILVLGLAIWRTIVHPDKIWLVVGLAAIFVGAGTFGWILAEDST